MELSLVSVVVKYWMNHTCTNWEPSWTPRKREKGRTNEGEFLAERTERGECGGRRRKWVMITRSFLPPYSASKEGSEETPHAHKHSRAAASIQQLEFQTCTVPTKLWGFKQTLRKITGNWWIIHENKTNWSGPWIKIKCETYKKYDSNVIVKGPQFTRNYKKTEQQNLQHKNVKIIVSINIFLKLKPSVTRGGFSEELSDWIAAV